MAPIFTREFTLLSIWSFLVGNNFYSLLTAVPLYALRVLKLTEAEAGVAAGLFIAGMLASRFASGKLMERLGFRIMLIGNLVFLIVFTLFYFIVDTPAGLYILRMASGIFYGLLINTILTLVSSIIPASRTGEGVGYYSMIQMSAWAVGPFISIYFSNQGDYNNLFLYCAVLPALIFATLPFFRLSRIHEAIARSDDAHLDDALAADTLPADALPDDTLSAREETFFEKFLEPAVLPIAACCVFLIMFNSAVTSFVAPFSETMGLEDSSSVFFIFYVIGLLATRPIVSKLYDRKGATFVMIPGVCIYVVAYLVLANANSHFSLMLAAVLIGVGLGACQNTTLALALSSVPRRRVGFASSTYYVAFDTCASAGPMIAGLLIPLIGYRYMFTVAAIWTAIGLPVYLLLAKKILYPGIRSQYK
ncbi:MAG: MFS transporter [Clostridiales Family XIII bacterium]|jgi:MFS family permease|nr:MFS transporter [Clostridiales Family XIII bacterium]